MQYVLIKEVGCACVYLVVVLICCCCWFGYLAASREGAAGTETGTGTGAPGEEWGNEATCAHTHSLVLLLPPHPTPLQVSKLMKKIDRLEKEVTAKQDILEQVSSGKGTRAQTLPLSLQRVSVSQEDIGH